ncbi:MAG TPA: diacylglycerol kinase [Cytophagales bacterium]|nr:diacylglycerol kinase [Cytophagales bacterium]HAA22666.1 diacylglycerol kinase [Cytophagales bacterium]HAP58019.1 diacylglycerol kinase [Cytophagales bacterium]
MNTRNSVYLGCSLDGYIAGPNGELDWLDIIPNPEGSDMGYVAFMEQVDALLMGRKTFETVLGFDVDWPYTKPVYVWSRTLEEIPASHEGKAFLVKGGVAEILEQIHAQGHYSLYIDGGQTVQSFLQADAIDDLTISTLPILLGDGVPLYGKLSESHRFELISSTVHLGQIVQNHYRRLRSTAVE